MEKTLLLLLALSGSAFAHSDPVLSPFSTDSCSLWFDGMPSSEQKWDDWYKCCVVHDMAYWQGGLEIQRERADRVLFECVRDSGHKVMAWMIYMGVVVGGHPAFDAPYSWGFGWTPSMRYRALTSEQKTLARIYLADWLQQNPEFAGKLSIP